jgi:hypothetical protein
MTVLIGGSGISQFYERKQNLFATFLRNLKISKMKTTQRTMSRARLIRNNTIPRLFWKGAGRRTANEQRRAHVRKIDIAFVK